MKTNDFIIIHHSATARDKTTLNAINKVHQKLFNYKSSLGWYVGYHYFIAGNGIIRQTRKDADYGAHCRADNMNSKAIGICLSGNFEIEQPSEKQLVSLEKIVERLKKDYNIKNDNILGHCQVLGAKTACPGKNLLSWIERY
ncbi:MAG: peptidoglycan recognition family protein [bacterium]|nr:peptidoglycan recognition family protein [bacterium]